MLLLAGRHEEARERYRAALGRVEALARDRPGDYRVNRALALAHSGLGQHERAVSAAEEALEIMPIAADGWFAPDLVEDLALVLARAGRFDEAVDRLRFLVDTPSRNRITPAVLRLDPRWDPLRSHPGFARLAASR